MRNVQLRLNYDEKFDVLYVAFADVSNSYGDDSEPGLIYLRDMDTDALTGVTFMHFKAKLRAGCLPELESDVPVDYDELVRVFEQN